VFCVDGHQHRVNHAPGDRRPATRAICGATGDGSRFLMLQADPAQPRQSPLVLPRAWASRVS